MARRDCKTRRPGNVIELPVPGGLVRFGIDGAKQFRLHTAAAEQ